MRVSGPGTIIGSLADTVSKNGNLLLNISPMPDGTIPQEQQDTLLAVGAWLDVNGEAIYGTHAWTKFGETVPRSQSGLNVRFTVKGEALYAIILGAWPGVEALIPSLAADQTPAGKITGVTMLGSPDRLTFTQDAAGLKVEMPKAAPCQYGYTLKIIGLRMNPALWTASGNPQ